MVGEKAHAILQKALKDAVQEGMITRNVAERTVKGEPGSQSLGRARHLDHRVIRSAETDKPSPRVSTAGSSATRAPPA